MKEKNGFVKHYKKSHKFNKLNKSVFQIKLDVDWQEEIGWIIY